MRKNRFFKTLLGYKILIVNKDYEYLVIHRPFRHPITESTYGKKSLRGGSYEMLIYDEVGTYEEN